jgi:hypothetical protein
MSRAFVREEGSDDVPRRHFALPEPSDPGFDAAAALAMLEAAREGEMHLAEEATGYRWGEPVLHPYVERLLQKELAQPEAQQDDRFITLARRFLQVRSE